MHCRLCSVIRLPGCSECVKLSPTDFLPAPHMWQLEQLHCLVQLLGYQMQCHRALQHPQLAFWDSLHPPSACLPHHLHKLHQHLGSQCQHCLHKHRLHLARLPHPLALLHCHLDNLLQQQVNLRQHLEPLPCLLASPVLHQVNLHLPLG